MNRLKSLALRTLALIGIGVTSERELRRLRKIVDSNLHADLKLLSSFKPEVSGLLLKYLEKSPSQLNQDLVALAVNNFRSNGYFVEFGATDGYSLSNTYLLEKYFGWRGILAEPGKYWHEKLTEKRVDSNIDTRCVWKESGELLEFNEAMDASFSTVDLFSSKDMHSKLRRKGQNYSVQSVTLVDLLNFWNAPNVVDYLSIDTEGTELEILRAFDWNSYTFNFISCEHNYSSNRESINSILTSNGYHRILEEFSEFDDWYVRDLSKFESLIAHV